MEIRINIGSTEAWMGLKREGEKESKIFSDSGARQTTTIAQDGLGATCKTEARRKEKRELLANYKRFNLSYYNLHTADAHIDLFEPWMILEGAREKPRKKKKAERQALV